MSWVFFYLLPQSVISNEYRPWVLANVLVEAFQQPGEFTELGHGSLIKLESRRLRALELMLFHPFQPLLEIANCLGPVLSLWWEARNVFKPRVTLHPMSAVGSARTNW